MQSRGEFRALLAIAAPVVVVQVGLMLMGVVDTIMVGHLSSDALAAVAVANLYLVTLQFLGFGTLMALDPLVSQAVGARDTAAVSRAIQRGLVLSLALGVLTMIGMFPAAPVLRLFRQPAAIIPDATVFVNISAVSMIPFMVFVVLRQSLQAMARLAPIVWTIVLANVLNVGLNWVLIFGNLGAPQLGVAGSAIATVVSRFASVFLLFALSWQELRPHMRFDRSSVALGPLWQMLALGLPIGFQFLLEVAAFNAVGLLMGTFGAELVAGHQIALNLAALTFMVPVGISAGAAVRVGHAIGAGDLPRSRQAARLSYVLCFGFMAIAGVVFLTLPEELAAIYTRDPTLIAITAALIPIAGVFQIFDGLQAVGAGVLRGLGDTGVPLAAMLVGYWLIGLPVSVWLGFRTSVGPPGLWWGFVAGLGVVAAFLLLRVLVLFRRGVKRVVIKETIVSS